MGDDVRCAMCQLEFSANALAEIEGIYRASDGRVV